MAAVPGSWDAMTGSDDEEDANHDVDGPAILTQPDQAAGVALEATVGWLLCQGRRSERQRGGWTTGGGGERWKKRRWGMEEEDESNGWVPHADEEEDVKRGDSGTILIL